MGLMKRALIRWEKYEKGKVGLWKNIARVAFKEEKVRRPCSPREGFGVNVL